MTHRPLRALLAAACLLATAANAAAPAAAASAAAASAAAASAAAAPSPKGYSQLEETYGQWKVSCGPQNGKQLCAVSQAQFDEKTKRRALAIELVNLTDSKANGAILLPFGLALGKGITLQIDDAAAGPARMFSTCLPAGCLVPLVLDGSFLTAARKGKTLKIGASTADGKPVSILSFPLDGLDTAVKRAEELTK